MYNFSIIQKSQLEGASRLDAEYYQQEYLDVRKKLQRLPHETLERISAKFKKGIFDIKAETYTTSGVPFIRISNLKYGFIDKEEIAHISAEADEKEKDTSLSMGDIVLSKTAYPAASLVNFVRANISQDIIGISLKKEWRNRILPHYLVAFLNSKFGILEMQQWFQGNVQMHLALPDAKTIIVPLLPINLQEQIAILFKNAINSAERSKIFYLDAENLLLDQLGSRNFLLNGDLSYVVHFSDITSAQRLDAEYFQPLIDRVISQVRKQECVTISDIQEFNRRGVQPKYIDEGEVYVVRSQNLGEQTIDYWNLDKTTKEEWRKTPGAHIQKNDVLIYTTGANVGRTNCYLKDDYALASNHVNILRVKEINPIYLAVYLNSFIGQAQVRRFVSGSAQVELYPTDIEKFIVWKAPPSVQERIADLVRKSHEARKKSKELLEQAKREVEEMIEKE